MNESLYKYMKVGLVHFMAFPTTMKGEGPVVETIERIVRDEYFTAVEISCVGKPSNRAAVRKMLQSSHMTVAYGGQPRLLTKGLNLNALDEEIRHNSVSEMKDGIDEAYDLGASSFAFLAGQYQEEHKDKAYQLLIKSTLDICAYAKLKGDLRIALEVFDYDVDKKSLIGPAALAAQYAKDIRQQYPDFGLMIDLSHIPLIHETIEDSVLTLKDYIVHAHIGNCVVQSPDLPAYGDVHPRFGFPGGENDVPEISRFLRVLLDIGYFNTQKPPVLSFEIKPFGDEDPEIVIANAKRTLNEAWARV